VPSAKKPLAVLFLTVFVDLLGFGIHIPVLPTYAQDMGASGTMVGLLSSIYSVTQMLFAPLWGRLSDRVGRRPVIVATALGSSAAYVVFGLAESLPMLFVARGLAGICAANIATAQAYVADVTSKEDRARGMGMIGAALGLGFTVGPALGGLAAHFGGVHMPFFVAAALALANAVWAFFALPEPPNHAPRVQRGFATIVEGLKMPAVGFYVLMMLLVTTAFANIENAFVLFNHARLGFGERDNGLVFTFIGVILVVMQMGAVRPLSRRYGPERLVAAGTLIAALGSLAILPAYVWWQLLPGTAIVAIGTALYSPSLSASISLAAPSDRQGEMLGLYQSAGALGRVIGPALAGLAFDRAITLPFYMAAVLLMLGSATVSARLYRQTSVA
jgi:MFS transporter, DHA1 family, tetracycline resistance protein